VAAERDRRIALGELGHGLKSLAFRAFPRPFRCTGASV